MPGYATLIKAENPPKKRPSNKQYIGAVVGDQVGLKHVIRAIIKPRIRPSPIRTFVALESIRVKYQVKAAANTVINKSTVVLLTVP
jgi:hypothetical protein